MEAIIMAKQWNVDHNEFTEAAIKKVIETDVLVVGAGNAGMGYWLLLIPTLS